MRKRFRRAAALTLVTLAVVWVAVAAVAAVGTPEPVAATTESGEPAGPLVPAGAPSPTQSEPEQGVMAVSTISKRALPSCEVGDEPTARAELGDWPYTVLDTRFMLPAAYAPTDLVDLGAALSGISRYAAPAGMLFREVGVADLQALVQDAQAAGIALEVISAYRSFDYQQRTFDGWVAEDGYEQALRSSARAGHSEHQLGTALDLRTRGGPPAWDLADWATTPEGAWTAANAWRYGFVMSYPSGKESITCYMYEPWHYRYLGRELAAEVHASGLTTREYLWNLETTVSGE